MFLGGNGRIYLVFFAHVRRILMSSGCAPFAATYLLKASTAVSGTGVPSGNLRMELAVCAAGCGAGCGTDFVPLARKKGLKFKVVPSSIHIRTDRNLLQRLVQNLDQTLHGNTRRREGGHTHRPPVQDSDHLLLDGRPERL